MVAAISATDDLLPYEVHAAHLMPVREGESPWKQLKPRHFSAWTDDFLEFITELENEFSESVEETYVEGEGERAILISAFQKSRREAEASMQELTELAKTAGVHVVRTAMQRQDKVNPKTLIGSGKLTDLAIQSMADGVELCIVDANLSASQAGAIADAMDVKVIDRTQLILEIFAQHANSREGKIQVELAQLRYLLPRLSARDDSLSRLTGGIGSKGPGETKLEIGRRRTQDRIRRLEKQLKKMANSRQQRRSRRQQSDIPIISIVGYTNAGKSTLLNALTRSDVTAEDKLFATLDTASRRLRFPREREVIITDTVGFIRELPPDLMAAFKATLEELEDADLLLHVIDASSGQMEQHKESVEEILRELELASIPRIRVYNKVDLLDEETRLQLEREQDGVLISAETGENFIELLKEMESHVWKDLTSSAIISGQAASSNQ
jgi:GTP-binding protein HflX